MVKSKPSIASPEKIKQIDQEVKSNWAKLAKGQLEISDAYRTHLTEGGSRLCQGPPQISSGSYHELTQSILFDHSKSLEPVKPLKKGKFGVILSDYQQKLNRNKPDSLPLGERDQIVVDVPDGHMLSEGDEVRNLTGLRNPEIETSRINVEKVDPKLKRAGHITLETFRKDFLIKQAKKGAKSGNQTAKVYLDWLQKEEQTRETKLPAFKIEDNLETESTSKVQKYLEQSDEATKGPPNPFKYKPQEHKIRPKVSVPSDLKPGQTFQVGDCFYDSNGEFIYRVPGLLQHNRDF